MKLGLGFGKASKNSVNRDLDEINIDAVTRQQRERSQGRLSQDGCWNKSVFRNSSIVSVLQSGAQGNINPTDIMSKKMVPPLLGKEIRCAGMGCSVERPLTDRPSCVF